MGRKEKKDKFAKEGWRQSSKGLKEMLIREIYWLELAREGYEKKEKVNLEGRLRVNRHREGVSYFVVKEKADSHGCYLKQADKEIAAQYAQLMYDQKIEKRILVELRLAKQLLENITYFFHIKYLKQMQPGRRELIKVLCQEDARYEEDWAQKVFTQLNWKTEEKVFKTKGGVAVRSKSEKIIGELLEESGLRFRYEARLQIGDKIFYPDFTILSPETHEEIIWEHFGFMQDEDYRRETYEKIEAYTSAGFLENRCFMTFEEGTHKFNQKLAEQIVARLRRTD